MLHVKYDSACNSKKKITEGFSLDQPMYSGYTAKKCFLHISYLITKNIKTKYTEGLRFNKIVFTASSMTFFNETGISVLFCFLLEKHGSKEYNDY